MRIFDRCRVVGDIIDARDGELAKEAEFFQLLVVDRDSDAIEFLGDDNDWARPWRRGVLDEAYCE